MAQDRAQEREIQESVELGARNAALIPRLERWCNHLKVELVSSGMLAQIYHLPIGRLQIVCPHASGGGVQAMQLDQVASAFVLQNCRNCKHHQELNTDNAGRDILRQADRITEERKQPSANPTPAARRLRGLVKSDLSQALREAPVTEQSILECVARLDIADQAEDAAKLLREAANLAPEFFNDLACEVIAEHMAGVFHGGDCAATLQIIGRKRGALPKVAVDAAAACLQSEMCADEALDLLADHIAAGAVLPFASMTAVIVRRHGHQTVGIVHTRPVPAPGQVRLLSEIAKRDLNRVAEGINLILDVRDAKIRIAGPVAISALLPGFPDLGPLVLDRLTRSLELDVPDRFGPSADVYACDAIAEILTFHPESTAKHLEAAAAAASDEGQELLVKVFERLSRDTKEEGPEHDRALKVLPLAIDALFKALMDASRPLRARETAADTLSHIAWNQPTALVGRLDSLLGALALVAGEWVKAGQDNPKGNPLLPGFPHENVQKLEHTASKLRDAVEKLVPTAAAAVFDSVIAMLSTLDSTVPAQEYLKWHLVGLLEDLAEDHEIGPRAIPPLYNALMDVQSVIVRARALHVIERVLASSDELVPDNMREMVVLYMRDSYVAIHQAAAKAARYLRPATAEQADEILKWLHAQFELYHKKAPDHFHLEPLAESAARICARFPQLFRTHALPLLVAQAKSTNDHHAREALDEWRRSAPAGFEYERIYVALTADYFARCPHDTMNWRPHDPGHDLFVSLFSCSRASIVANAARFVKTITTLATKEPFEALQLVCVLFHHEQYATAALAAKAIAEALPPGERYVYLRNQALVSQAAAEAELLAVADPAAAAKRLEAESKHLPPYVPHSDGNHAKAFIESLSMADQVAARLRGV